MGGKASAAEIDGMGLTAPPCQSAKAAQRMMKFKTSRQWAQKSRLTTSLMLRRLAYPLITAERIEHVQNEDGNTKYVSLC